MFCTYSLKIEAETCLATRECAVLNAEAQNPLTRVYINLSLEMAACTCITEGGVNIASD